MFKLLLRVGGNFVDGGALCETCSLFCSYVTWISMLVLIARENPKEDSFVFNCTIACQPRRKNISVPACIRTVSVRFPSWKLVFGVSIFRCSRCYESPGTLRTSAKASILIPGFGSLRIHAPIHGFYSRWNETVTCCRSLMANSSRDLMGFRWLNTTRRSVPSFDGTVLTIRARQPTDKT